MTLCMVSSSWNIWASNDILWKKYLHESTDASGSAKLCFFNQERKRITSVKQMVIDKLTELADNFSITAAKDLLQKLSAQGSTKKITFLGKDKSFYNQLPWELLNELLDVCLHSLKFIDAFMLLSSKQFVETWVNAVATYGNTMTFLEPTCFTKIVDFIKKTHPAIYKMKDFTSVIAHPCLITHPKLPEVMDQIIHEFTQQNSLQSIEDLQNRMRELEGKKSELIIAKISKQLSQLSMNKKK